MPATDTRLVLWTQYARDLLVERLAGRQRVELVAATSEAEVAEALRGADALLTEGHLGGYTPAIAAAVRSADRLRWIQVLTMGVDGLTTNGVRTGVLTTGLGDAYAAPVAEHALALLLALVRRVPEMVVNGERRAWDRSLMQRLDCLEGKTAAVLGFGNIGQAFARRAQAFGMTLLAVNRSGQLPAGWNGMACYPMERLTEALALANVLVIALPLAPDTANCISTRELAACRPGSYLVNVGRGGLVDEDAMLAALASGQLKAAGLDVTAREPLPTSSPLWQHPQVLVSPHVGGAGSEPGRQRMLALMEENVGRFLAGEAMRNPLEIRAAG